MNLFLSIECTQWKIFWKKSIIFDLAFICTSYFCPISFLLIHIWGTSNSFDENGLLLTYIISFFVGTIVLWCSCIALFLLLTIIFQVLWKTSFYFFQILTAEELGAMVVIMEKKEQSQERLVRRAFMEHFAMYALTIFPISALNSGISFVLIYLI